MSNIRRSPSLPSYDSVGSSHVSPYGASPNMNLSVLEQHTHPDPSPKSYGISTSQALDDLTEIKGWPEQPRRLRDRTVLSILFSISEVLVTLAPVAFISKTSCQEVTGNPDRTQYWLLLLPSSMANLLNTMGLGEMSRESLNL